VYVCVCVTGVSGGGVLCVCMCGFLVCVTGVSGGGVGVSVVVGCLCVCVCVGCLVAQW